MTQLPSTRELRIQAGKVRSDPNTAVQFGDTEFATHMAVYGGTGKGKSKFLELILRQIIDQNRGVCVIDPHGDLVEDLMLYVMQRKNALDPEISRRIHYFEPGLKGCEFSFDPFRYREAADGQHDYDDWLKAKVESVAKVIIRKQGESDFQGRPRLERFLTNVLYCVGTRINDAGDHLPLADAEILLNTNHPSHNRVFDRISPFLPTEVAADFDKVRKSSPRQQEDWVESTIGRLRSFLSPAIKALFTNEAKEVLDFRSLVENQGVMLVNLRRTRSFTLDQSNAVGGLFINEILEAVETAERNRRTPFYLFIDEASRFVGQDLMDALGQFRKWKLSMCLAVQDLSSLRGKEIDMAPKVMSQCGIQVTFQQKYPDDVDMLAHLFGYPSIDYTRMVQEVDRPDGYEEVDTRSETHGESKSASDGKSKTTGYGYDPNLTVTGYKHGDAENKASGEGESSSVTMGTQYLSRTRVELRDMGKLRTTVNDQLDYVKTSIRKLGMGEALALIGNVDPFVLQVHNVEAPFATVTPEKKTIALEKYKRHICRAHAYCLTAGPAGEAKRLSSFLNSSSPSESAEAEENPFDE
jgi:hypothetical protein